MQQTGHHTVEEVEHGTDHDEQQCQIGYTHECPIGGDAARNQVAASYGIGNMLFNIHYSLFLRHLGNNGLVAGCGLSHRNAGLGGQRQKDIHTRSEFDKGIISIL